MSPPIILVADEDLDTRIILKALLEQQGYQVIEAATPAAAMEAAQASISLVILNHPLSVDEDTSLARWLRGQPSTREVPIINLTSRAVPLLLDEAARQGVNITLTKPLDVVLIARLVREMTMSTMGS